MVERYLQFQMNPDEADTEYVRFSDYETLRYERDDWEADAVREHSEKMGWQVRALAAEARAEKAVEELERLREATNRKKVGQAYLVGGSTPRAIVDHAISALDLSMMRHDMIEDLKAGRVKPALASLPKESADAD